MMKNLMIRFKLVWSAIKIACRRPKLEMTDTMVLAQWGKFNSSIVVTRSINHLLGLFVGQIAIVKNEEPRLRVNNKKFVDWVADGLDKSLHVNDRNTPPYERLHVRKVKMRQMRKYR